MLQATFTSLVISGGAAKLLAALGCVKYFEENDLLFNVRNFVGTSAGSAICFFLVLGYSSQEILNFMKSALENNELSNILDTPDIFAITKTLGVSEGKGLTKLFQKILHDKTHNIDITFLDLAKKFGKNLVVCVSNITTEKEEYMSVDTTPDASVIDALRMSCSIPLLFTPVKWNGCVYVDGGLYNNFPLTYFLHKGQTFADIIGINIENTNYNDMTDIFSYMNFLLNTIIMHLNRLQIDNICNGTHVKERNIITIKMQDAPWIVEGKMNISFTDEELNDIIQKGYDKARDILTKNNQ